MVNIFDEGSCANALVERVATAAVRTAHVVNFISLNVLFSRDRVNAGIVLRFGRHCSIESNYNGSRMNRRKVLTTMVAGAAAAATVSVASAADKEIEILVGHWRKSKD